MYCGPKDLPIGLVTRTDEYIIYVWANNFGYKELRYPLAAIPNAEPGDRVRFYQREDFCKIQSAKDLFLEHVVDLTISKLPKFSEDGKAFRFKVFTHVIFPPATDASCHNYINSGGTCQAVAFSPLFHRVACFQDMNYKPGVLYKAYVSRIPKAYDSMVSKLETLFTFVDTRLVEVHEEPVILERSILESVPWRKSSPVIVTKRKSRARPVSGERREDSSAISNDFQQNHRKKLSVLTASHTDQRQTSFSYGQYKKSYIAGERYGNFRKNDSTHLLTVSNSSSMPSTSNASSIGIVVRVEHNHAVIWSRQHGLVFVPPSDSLNLSVWVSYKCIENHPVEGASVRRAVYSMEEIKPPRLSDKLQSTVQVFAKVKLDSFQSQTLYSPLFVMAYDDVLGGVLCSKDEYLMSRLRNGDRVEVLVMYTENHSEFSKWIAFAVSKRVEDWRKLTKLPDIVDQLASTAFEINGKRNLSVSNSCQEKDETRINGVSRVVQQVETQSTLYFRPPHDWIGPIPLSDKKISEVLALVVEREDDGQMAVLYTQYGLARHQNEYPIGDWVKITMVQDPEEDIESYENIAENYSLSYYAIKCKKIAPPMSTRIIKSEEGNRILMCGTVEYGARCLENQFLGIIQDTKKRLVIDYSHPPGPLGFLVEMALLRKKRLPRKPLFWQVVKFHGNAEKNVNSVPLKDSYVPVAEPPELSSQTELGNAETRNEEKSLIVSITDSNYNHQHEKAGGPCEPVFLHAMDNQAVPIETWHLDDERRWFNNSVENLLYYKPNMEEKMSKSLGLVVKKQEKWALVYSKKFGIGLLRAADCKSAEDKILFVKKCNPGNWIGINYIKLVENVHNKFKYMCLPSIEAKESVLPTKVENNIVQAKIDVDLTDATILPCEEDPTLLKVNTVLGNVLFSQAWHTNHGNRPLSWVFHIPSYDGCHWSAVEYHESASSSTSSTDIFSTNPPNCFTPIRVPLEETVNTCAELCSASFLLDSRTPSPRPDCIEPMENVSVREKETICGEKAYGEPFYSHLPNIVHQKINQGHWNQTVSLASLALREMQENKLQNLNDKTEILNAENQDTYEVCI